MVSVSLPEDLLLHPREETMEGHASGADGHQTGHSRVATVSSVIEA